RAAAAVSPDGKLDALADAPEFDDPAVADAVVSAYLAARPDSVAALAHAAVAKVRRGKAAEARDLYRRARAVPAVRDAAANAFLEGVVRHKVPVAGYKAVPDDDRPE